MQRKLRIRTGRRLWSHRSGAALVEAALVLPVVITFLFGILEYGRYIMTLQVVTNAAREGAHYALAHTDPVIIAGTTYGNATTDVTKAVTNAMGGQQLSNQQIQVFASTSLGVSTGPWADAEAGDCICVRITGDYKVILGKLLGLTTSIPVVAQSVMRSESN